MKNVNNSGWRKDTICNNLWNPFAQTQSEANYFLKEDIDQSWHHDFEQSGKEQNYKMCYAGSLGLKEAQKRRERERVLKNLYISVY